MPSGLQPARDAPVQFGKYTLMSRIATGGMGELHLAQLRAAGGFEKLVVIKRILPHLTDQREFVEMFVEEARTAARITHPNVCQIYELGQVDGRYYMALEYMEGVPLADVMVARKRAPQLADLRLVTSLIAQAAEGLHHAHSLRNSDGSSAQLVHRDVNPRNIFVTSAGVAKVLDFGIVKVRGALNRTRTGSIKGTYSYSAPEQLQGEPLDCTADVFSLGIIMWEAVVGRRLFKRASDLLTWKAIVEEPIPRPSKFRYDLPPELDAAIMRALERRREDRFPSAREMALSLERSIQSLGAPYTTLAISAEIEKAFAGELQEQRERVFAAHKRQEAERLSAGPLEDWAEEVSGAETLVASEDYGSLVGLTSNARLSRPLPPRPASEARLHTPSELHTLENLPIAKVSARGTSEIPRGTRPRHAARAKIPPQSARGDEAPVTHDTPWPSGLVTPSGSRVITPAPQVARAGRRELRSRSPWPMVLALIVFGTGAAALAYVLKKNEIDDRPVAAAPVAKPAALAAAPAPGAAPAAEDAEAAREAAGEGEASEDGERGDGAGAGAGEDGAAQPEGEPRERGGDGEDAADQVVSAIPPGGEAAGAARRRREREAERERREARAEERRAEKKEERREARSARKDDRKDDKNKKKNERKSDSKSERAPERQERRPARTEVAAADSKGSGYLTINAEPYATLYVDGKKRGYTPVVRLSLPPGNHSLRLVSSAGQPDKKIRVKIKAGEELRKFVKW